MYFTFKEAVLRKRDNMLNLAIRCCMLMVGKYMISGIFMIAFILIIVIFIMMILLMVFIMRMVMLLGRSIRMMMVRNEIMHQHTRVGKYK